MEVASYAAGAVLGIWGSGESQRTYVDYATGMFRAAELNFHGPDALLDFYNYRVNIDAPGAGQGWWRAGRNLVRSGRTTRGGSDWQAVTNLTPACFVFIKQLDPINNPSSRLTCLLAWRALYLLAHHYKSNPDRQTAYIVITASQIRMLEDMFKMTTVLRDAGLQGALIARNYGLPDLSTNALVGESNAFWGNGGTNFDQLHNHYVRALVSFLQSQTHDSTVQTSITAANSIIEQVATKIERLATNLSSVSGASPEDFNPPFDITRLKAQFPKRDLITFHALFWPWFSNLPDTDEQFWADTGLPIAGGPEYRTTTQRELFAWMGLPMAPVVQSPSVVPRSATPPVMAAASLPPEPSLGSQAHVVAAAPTTEIQKTVQPDIPEQQQQQ